MSGISFISAMKIELVNTYIDFFAVSIIRIVFSDIACNIQSAYSLDFIPICCMFLYEMNYINQFK